METELWIDEERKLAHGIARRDDHVVAEYLDASGDALRDPFIQAFVVPGFFQDDLEQGRARLVGEGTVQGRPVRWLELVTPPGAPASPTWRVAVDALGRTLTIREPP